MESGHAWQRKALKTLARSELVRRAKFTRVIPASRVKRSECLTWLLRLPEVRMDLYETDIAVIDAYLYEPLHTNDTKLKQTSGHGLSYDLQSDSD
jgi:hypothetical protein